MTRFGQIDGKLGTQARLARRPYHTPPGLPTTGELDAATRRAFGLK